MAELTENGFEGLSLTANIHRGGIRTLCTTGITLSLVRLNLDFERDTVKAREDGSSDSLAHTFLTQEVCNLHFLSFSRYEIYTGS